MRRDGEERPPTREERGIMRFADDESIEEIRSWNPKKRVIAGAYSANYNLATRYRLAGEEQLALNVSTCRRTFEHRDCGSCGASSTGAPSYVCGDRLCVLCGNRRAATHGEHIKEIVRGRALDLRHLSILTVTVQNTPTISPAHWRETGVRYNALRHWIDGVCGWDVVRGGFRSSEVTAYDAEVNGFNLHTHSMVEHATPVPLDLLSDLWLVASAGAGYVVDIQRLRSPTKSGFMRGLREVAKNRGSGAVKLSERELDVVEQHASGIAAAYMTKVQEISDPATLMEVHRSLKGVRLTEAFGAWRTYEAVEPDEGEDAASDTAQDDQQNCASCGSDAVLVTDRKLSIKDSINALYAWCAASRKRHEQGGEARAGPATIAQPPPQFLASARSGAA